MEQLIEIAKALNENILANRTRSKDEKIENDVFIRKFNITRKNFSATIKDTEIKYNQSAGLYDIPGVLPNNYKVTNIDVKPIVKAEQQNNNKVTTIDVQPSNYKVTPVNEVISLENIPTELQKIMSFSQEIEEMLYWYRRHKDDDNIIEIPEININHRDFEGTTTVRSFKTYTKVLDKFAEYCKGKKETQKDLLALALVEFMEKYK